MPNLRLDLPATRVETTSQQTAGGRATGDAASIGADEVPPEFNDAAGLERYYTVAGFTEDAQQAYGTALMWYHANHAQQSVDLTLRYNGSEVTSTSALSEEAFWLPASRVMYTRASLPIGD
ncbi:MAG TPA: hypothetical protein VJ596_12000, partial [Gemmatimonadaceae bacterium]|nr:hypothetical protein [Gemmatimonadaceae bacterium]